MSVVTAAPQGVNGETLQVLRYRQGAGFAHQISMTTTTARNGTGFNTATRVVELRSTADCFFQQGDDTITATTGGHFLPASETRLVALGGDNQTQYTHIAAILSSGTGTLYISEME